MIFFTSDTHFGHVNILKYCHRPFANIEEHDAALINRWNSVVKPGDVVYHLGDFGFGDSKYLKTLCQKLTGNIHLIRGNHDTNVSQMAFRFNFIKDTHLIETKLSNNKIKVFLSHYPHRTWIHKPRDCYHLFGHVHGNMGPYGLSFDVGVDNWNYTPISLEEVHNYVQTQLYPQWQLEKTQLNAKNVEFGMI
jgi:calcineurin-like phosphoesterase family protein